LAAAIAFHEANELDLAYHFLERAAAQDDVTAVGLLGIALRHGHGTRPDPRRATCCLARAVHLTLADLAATTPVLDRLRGRLLEQVLGALLHEVATDLRMRGWHHRPSRPRAVFFCRAAAALGHPEASYEWGMRLATGDGVRKDKQAASACLRRLELQTGPILDASWIWKPKWHPQPEE
ncbi:hypothetical protein CXG81DRAFT_4629, partial [Caulochytrium protostelioides]